MVMDIVNQVEVPTDKTATVGGSFSSGGGHRHDCLQRAEVIGYKYGDFGEMLLDVQCTICGNSKQMSFVRTLS